MVEQKKPVILGFIFAVLLLGLYASIRLSTPGAVETDLLSLLPRSDRPEGLNRLISAASTKGSAEFALAVLNTDQEQALSTAAQLAGSLSQLSNVQLREEGFAPSELLLGPGLLGSNLRKILERKNDSSLLAQRIEAALYSPQGTQLSQQLTKDPLFLLRDYLSQFPTSPRYSPLGGFIVGEYQGQYAVLVRARVIGSALDAHVQEGLKSWLTIAQRSVTNASSIIPIGFIWLADETAHTIQADISTLTGVSFFSVFGLLFLVFKSLRTTLLSTIPALIALVVATGSTLFFFSSIHMITLGFGAGLLGVAVDYAEHYLCERTARPRTDSKALLSELLPGLRSAFLTSVIGYSFIGLPNFPGLRQIAVFAVSGLIGAYLTVVFTFPRLTERGIRGRAQTKALFSRIIFASWKQFYSLSPVIKAVAVLGFLGLCSIGVVRLKVDDNVKVLSPLPEDRLAREASLSPNPFDSRFFLVTGQSEDERTERERQLLKAIDRLSVSNVLDGYLASTSLLPTPADQHENVRRLCAQLDMERLSLEGLSVRIGLHEKAFSPLYSVCVDSEKIIERKDLPGFASRALEGLEVADGDDAARIVLLRGIESASPLAALEGELPGIHFIDRAGEASTLLGKYRVLALMAIAAALLAVYALFWVRYGTIQSLRALVPPLTALAGSLAAMGWSGISLNLFSTFALLLVIETAVDYSIFMSEETKSEHTTMLAISVCAFTTVLSFGVLSLSAVPLLRSFGFPIAVGILLSLVTAPTVFLGRTHRGAEVG